MDSVSSQKRMVVPSPWRLSALISPPWAFTMAAQTESPMPMLCLPWSAVSSAGSIPENSFFSRSYLCIDMNPASQGLKGQIIAIWHDDGKRSIKADSFAQWFGTFTQSITKNL